MSDSKRVKTSLDVLYEALAEQEVQARRRLACEKQIAIYTEELKASAAVTNMIKIGRQFPCYNLNHHRTQIAFNGQPYFPVLKRIEGNISPEYAEIARVMVRVIALHQTYKDNVSRAYSAWGQFGLSTVYGTSVEDCSQFVKIGFPPFKYGIQIPYPDGRNSIQTDGVYRIAVDSRKFWNSV